MNPLEDRYTNLVRSSAKLVRTAILRAGGRAAAGQADDLEQRVYLALWKRFTAQNGPPAEIAPAYLYRIAVRETVHALERLPLEDDLESLPESAAPDPGPERRAASAELGRRVAAALADLDPDRRRAAAAHLQGFEVAEIERLFGWSYQRARNLIARGMADLRGALAGE